MADAVAGYAVETQDLLTAIDDLPEAAAHLLKAKTQLKSRSNALASEGGPYWRPFFSKLACGPSDFGKSKERLAARGLLDAYFESEAYAFPFLAASEHFILEVDKRYRQKCSAEHAPQIYASLVKWYVSRAIETARFVLHLVYSRSGLNYPRWSELFRQSEAVKSPWGNICAEFPVLVRWLADIDRNIQASLGEMFQRLDCDRKDLEAHFAIPQRAKVSAIATGLSDPHRGGRTVMRLTFSNGSTIIYKPKPLSTEAEFNKFAKPHRFELGIAALNVLPRSGYGWVEDAGDAPQSGYLLHSPTSIGRAAACFWLLNATDLHFENVRPSPGGVYALDVETLLAAPVAAEKPDHEPLWRYHSINATLLFNASVGESGKILNISGFNPSPNLSLPSDQLRFEVVGDTVRMSTLPTERVQSGEFTPTASHPPTVVADVINAFRLGSGEGGRKLVESFVAALDDCCPLRFVFRDTYFYARLLDRMRQPRFMRDGALLSLDLLLLHGGIPSGSALADCLHAIVDDEIRQLLQGDIPYFSYEAGGLDLHTSGGTIVNFFEMSAKSYASAKVRELEDSDVAEQSALLAIALGTYLDIANESSVVQPQARPDVQPQRPLELFLLPLKELAESVVSSSFRPSRTPARWLSLFGDISGEQLKVDVGDQGFFGGAWGIILALQAAENALSGSQDTGLLREFLDNQAALWARCVGEAAARPQRKSPGLLGFSGLGGEIFAQSTLISLEPTRWGFLRAHIGGSLSGIDDAIASDKWLDVIGGSAGLALGCEQMLRLEVAPESAEAAAQAQQMSATHLMRMALDTGSGLAWKIPKEKDPLLGFAHGWAGVVAALASAKRRATSSAQESAIKTCLRDAAVYPQALFRIHHAWRDYRSGSLGGESLNSSWCHGVPGFLRGMLEIQKYWNEEVRSEIDSMIKRVRALASSNAYRFCCGEMGNIDFLLDYSRATSAPELKFETHSRLLRITEEILSFANNGGNKNRQRPELSFPGLFQGQSGLIYCAARFVLPDLASLSGQRMHFD